MPIFARNNRPGSNSLPNTKNVTSSKKPHAAGLTSSCHCIAISVSILLYVAISNILKLLHGISRVIAISRLFVLSNVTDSGINTIYDANATIELYTRLTKDAASIFMHGACVKQKICVVFSPYVDLRDHLEHEQEPFRQSLNSTVIPLLPPWEHSVRDRHTILTRCGYKGAGSQTNQDRAIVVSPFLLDDEDAIKVRDGTTSSPNFIMGVFDGHGRRGEVIAQHVARTLPKEIANQLELADSNNETYIKNALVRSFIQVDAAVPQYITDSGCTASLILRVRSKIYVANAGDSQSFIVSYHRRTKIVQIVYITRKDKPDLEDERKRIEAAGGTVFIPPEPNPGQTQKMPSRIRVIGLAMSRCIGDLDGKALGVIAEPIVDILDIHSLKAVASTRHDGSLQKSNDSVDVELFAVSASDGLLDYVPPLTVARFLATTLYKEEGANTHGVMVACEQLIQQSSKMWSEDDDIDEIGYRDDITIAVTKI